MKFLAINTSSDICSVSFYNDGNINTLEKNNVKEHSKYLASFAKELLKDNIKDISFISVAIGPGSYTGLKIGVSFAKGLSLAINKPIVPVETFLAMNEQINNNDKYYISIHSHRDYIFVQEIENNIIQSHALCTQIINLKGYSIYGYGLSNVNLNYSEIKPNSKDLVSFTLKEYNNLITNDISKVRPILLSK